MQNVHVQTPSINNFLNCKVKAEMQSATETMGHINTLVTLMRLFLSDNSGMNAEC